MLKIWGSGEKLTNIGIGSAKLYNCGENEGKFCGKMYAYRVIASHSDCKADEPNFAISVMSLMNRVFING